MVMTPSLTFPVKRPSLALLGAEPWRAALEFLSHKLAPGAAPARSIYSRLDGVVAWQSCRHDRQRAGVQDIEIQGSHIGMGWNSAVLKIVADRLAQRPGQWQRYAEPVPSPWMATSAR